VEIRSYRRVFDLERRVYSVDRLRLNPGGVPVRGIVYFLVLLLVSLFVARMPLVEGLLQIVPWYLSDLALPLLASAVLSVIRVEGRTFHLCAYALARYAVSPRQVCCLTRRTGVARRWCPDELLMLPDGSDSRMRRLRYTGPGAVLVRVSHARGGRCTERDSAGYACGPRRRGLTVRECTADGTQSDGEVICLTAGTRITAVAAKQ
jgi:hypothetical protein